MRYQSTRPKRQFLAGVSCPKCQAMDMVMQVQVFKPEFNEYIECCNCGYTERRPKASDLKKNVKNNNIKNHMNNSISVNLPIKNEPIIVNAGIAVANITDQSAKKMDN